MDRRREITARTDDADQPSTKSLMYDTPTAALDRINEQTVEIDEHPTERFYTALADLPLWPIVDRGHPLVDGDTRLWPRSAMPHDCGTPTPPLSNECWRDCVGCRLRLPRVEPEPRTFPHQPAQRSTAPYE